MLSIKNENRVNKLQVNAFCFVFFLFGHWMSSHNSMAMLKTARSIFLLFKYEWMVIYVHTYGNMCTFVEIVKFERTKKMWKQRNRIFHSQSYLVVLFILVWQFSVTILCGRYWVVVAFMRIKPCCVEFSFLPPNDGKNMLCCLPKALTTKQYLFEIITVHKSKIIKRC